MKIVFLDDLPKKHHAGGICIDWVDTIGYGIYFIYNNIKGIIYIEDYCKKDKKLKIKYNNNYYYINTISLCKCMLGKITGEFTNNFKISIGENICNEKVDFVIIDKKYTDSARVLRQQLSSEINKMIKEHETYFEKFDQIVMYYDNGQETLGTILDSIFLRFDGFEHRIEFDHKEKRLFQVSDMLTYIDKYDYKYKHKMEFTRSEKYFFTTADIRKILKELSKKRF